MATRVNTTDLSAAAAVLALLQRGRPSAEEIATATGLTTISVRESLGRLRSIGLVLDLEMKVRRHTVPAWHRA